MPEPAVWPAPPLAPPPPPPPLLAGPASHAANNKRNRDLDSSRPESDRILRRPASHGALSSMNPSAPVPRAEYDALPISIQRKHFSQLERLKIAENPAVQQTKTQQPSRSLHGLFSNNATICPAHGARLTFTTQPRNKLKKSQSGRQELEISQAEAQWFFSLPEKVRRSHFSREEQVLLAGLRDPYALEAADEPLRQGHRKQKQQERNRSLGGEDNKFAHSLPVSFRDRLRSQSLSHDSVIQQDQSQDADADSEILHIDKMPPTESSTGRRSRRSSIRRTLSLTTTPFIIRTSTSSAPPMASPANPPSNNSQWRPRASTSAGPESGDTIFSPTLDPAAKHYQDPEARMKLRLYLASPQKFDEAIEFGFPSTTEDEKPELATARPNEAAILSHDVQTFLRDENVSIMESHFDDAVSATEASEDDGDNSPATPASAADPFHFITRLADSPFSSLDSHGLPSLELRDFTQESYIQAPAAAREMTLRMTLTRPDLRAKEEDLYGWQKNMGGRNPLALEELPPPSDDLTGAHGAFAVNSKQPKGIVGRLLMKVKKGKI